MNHPSAVGTVLDGIVNLVATIEQTHTDPEQQLLAVCLDCKPILPMPFGTGEEGEAKRDPWVKVHEEATGHRVIRPERLGEELGHLSTAGRLVP